MTTFPLGEADYYSVLAKDSMYFYNTTYNVKQFMGTTNNLIQGGANYKIPFAPIINGAAASQAQKDVADTITLINGLVNTSTYKGKLVNVIVSGQSTLNNILSNNAPVSGKINRYDIVIGNITTTSNVTISGNESTVCVFIVNGNLTISYNIILSGGILPKNVIFIASDRITMSSATLQLNISFGIYIAYNKIQVSEQILTGRIISQNNIAEVPSDCTITPP